MDKEIINLEAQLEKCKGICLCLKNDEIIFVVRILDKECRFELQK